MDLDLGPREWKRRVNNEISTIVQKEESVDTTSTTAVYTLYLPATGASLPFVSTGEQQKSKGEVSI